MTRVALTLLLAVLAAGAQAAGRTTPYEDSGGRRTPRYDATVSWCRDLAESSPQLHFTSFGRSGEGRDLPLVVADREGRFAAEDHADRRDRVVLLVQACIHAGEACGKDAGMLLLRDLAGDDELARRLLDRVTLLFIPIFNTDGHERFSPYGRINQNGPDEMGWRVTATNRNLNRDYLKADTVEMQAWLGLWNRWLPDFFIDTHSTDGADYQYAVTYSLETHGNMDPGLTGWTRAYEGEITSRMAADGWPLAPYVSFRQWHDPTSGLERWAAGPRFSQGYAAIQNRPGLLVETHMLKDYAVRVEGVDRLVRTTMELLNEQAVDLRARVLAADARTASPEFRAEPLALALAASDSARTTDFLGVSSEIVRSEVTGGSWHRWGDEPVTLSLPLYDDLRPTVTADLPEAYLIPPQWTEVIERLDHHGVVYRRLTRPATLTVRGWRLQDPEWRSRPYEGRHPVTFSVESTAGVRSFPAGTVLVDMNQRAARVAAHLLEPDAPDALVGWGFFDAVFERVEYVESYVIEEMIPEMLAADPALADSLAARKAADPAFAADPWAIRYWFYAKTPWFDQRVGVYPVAALDDREQLRELE